MQYGWGHTWDRRELSEGVLSHWLSWLRNRLLVCLISTVLNVLLAQALPEDLFQPYFPQHCNQTFNKKETLMKYWYSALSNVQSLFWFRLYCLSRPWTYLHCTGFTDISLKYHCWLQWGLSYFTFTRTQKTALPRGKPGMLFSLSTLGEEQEKRMWMM